MSRRYITATDGEWIQPVRRGYHMACCSCGVVHRMDFRIVGERVQFRAWHAPRLTARNRKAKRIQVRTT